MNVAGLKHRLRSAIDRIQGRRVVFKLEPETVAFAGRIAEASRRKASSGDAQSRYSLSDLVQSVERHRAAVPPPLSDGLRDAAADVRHAHPSWLETFHARGAVAPDFFSQRTYVLGELTRFDGEEFLEVAYRAILKRPPDDAGRKHFLTRLEDGTVDRIDVIRALSRSPEGSDEGIDVPGLAWIGFWRRAEKVPLAGSVLAWIHTAARLPRLARHHRSLEARLAAERQHREQQERLAAEHARRLDSAVAALEAGLVEIEQRTLPSIAEALRVSEQREMQYIELAQQFTELIASLEAARIEMEQRTLPSLADGLRLLEQQARQFIEMAHDFTISIAVLEAGRDEIQQRTLPALAETLHRLEHESLVGSKTVKTLLDQQRETEARAVQQWFEDLHAVRSSLIDATGRLAVDATRASERIDALVLSDARQEELAGQTADALRPLIEHHNREHFSFEENRSLESFYDGLENRFRGARDEILKRFTPYLDFVRDAAVGTPDKPLIDLGCGRGEWLELLRLNHLHAHGIDVSQVAVDHCRATGLAAECRDVIDYLKSARSASFGAVSAMHLVEHLPFKTLIILVREIYRVLIPGGLLIFETPNPENLYVAAYAFRMDPTHRVPLPPPMLAYLVESQGFELPNVLRLNAGAYGDPFGSSDSLVRPDHASEALQDTVAALRAVVQTHLYSAPDFAVVARKPTGNAALPAITRDSSGNESHFASS